MTGLPVGWLLGLHPYHIPCGIHTLYMAMIHSLLMVLSSSGR